MTEEIRAIAEEIRKEGQVDQQTTHEFMQTLIDRKITITRARAIFDEIMSWAERTPISR